MLFFFFLLQLNYVERNSRCLPCRWSLTFCFLLQLLIQRFFFAVVTNQKFDIFIMIVILLNMILMGLEHYEQSEEFENGLYVVNTAFIVIFTTECVLKLISLRIYFFKQAWNVFDFVVVVVSVLGQRRGPIRLFFSACYAGPVKGNELACT